MGVRAGDRVAVSLANDIDVVTALVGIWTQGAVFVGVHTVLAPPEKRYLIDDCQPSLYLSADAEEDTGAPLVVCLD